MRHTLKKNSGKLAADGGCCRPHHLERVIAAQGHTVRSISPENIGRYRDADALTAASTRPTMHLVALKTEEQFGRQTAIHRGGNQVTVERTT
jgi:transposase